MPAAAVIGSILGLLIPQLSDPTLNNALGPQSGLQVTPVIFQSIESEGRWKPGGLVNSDASDGTLTSAGRVFELSGHAEPLDPPLPLTPTLQEPYGPLKAQHMNIFTVQVNGASLASALPDIWKVLNGDSGSAATSSFTVDATWWYDGLEIYAGWAGLANATGFGSAFNSNANVELQAIPFGNYYPASILLMWSGWVNPIGSDYWEFRGGIVLNADGTSSAPGSNVAPQPWQQSPGRPPFFMKYWSRDANQNPESVTTWKPETGFLFDKKPPPKPSSGANSALQVLLNMFSGGGLSSAFPGGT
jgi:hypothetical protein